MKRSTSYLKTFAFLFFSLFMAVAQAQEVSLWKADSRIHGRYGYSWQNYSIDILVNNAAFEKQVTVHYLDTDGQWKELEASFDRMVDDGQEIWKVSQSRSLSHPHNAPQSPLNLTFAIEYEVNGVTFWDNNGGQNYYMASNSGELITSNVLVDYATAAAPYDYQYGNNTGHVAGRFSIGVLLKNLDYAKEVKVHYTLDDWQTTYVRDLNFQNGRLIGYSWVTYPNSNGIEYWSMSSTDAEFQTDQATYVEYAVSYKVNGVTYWDNNFGNNYRTEISVR